MLLEATQIDGGHFDRTLMELFELVALLDRLLYQSNFLKRFTVQPFDGAQSGAQ